jgi:gamma-D-glutamyl-L-lysine dipeptidyl-peptidase
MNNYQLITENQQYACCVVSVSPLRAEKRDSSEQVSQILFGETIEILEFGMPWLKVRCLSDYYEGYVDIKQFIALTNKELIRWMDARVAVKIPFLFIETPVGKMMVSIGSYVGEEGAFNIGNHAFLNPLEGDLNLSLLEHAKQFLNVPYLWGGKSFFGIDCSGFTQLVFRLHDFNLPRDAYQQADLGSSVEFGDHEAGDVAFFSNDSGKIIHVGILLPENQIIHASGRVKIDEFTEYGIKVGETYTHGLTSIQRMIG